MAYRIVNLAEAHLACEGIYEDSQFSDSQGHKHVWKLEADALTWLNSRFYSAAERGSLVPIEIPIPDEKLIQSHMDTFNCGWVYKAALKDLKGLRAKRWIA